MARPNVGDRFPVGAVGDATAADVLEGKTFSSEPEGVNATGTMPNRGQQIIAPGTSNATILQGYHNGTGYVDGTVADVSSTLSGSGRLYHCDKSAKKNYELNPNTLAVIKSVNSPSTSSTRYRGYSRPPLSL